MVFNLNKYRLTFFFIISLLILISSCQNDNKKKKVVITRDMLMEHNRKLLGLEADVIKKYLEDNKIEMQQTPTGLWYRIVSDSTSSNAEKNQVAYLDYKVSLLDGTECYSSDKDGIWTIVVGKGEIESAVQEALLLVGEGDSIQFIAPPHLAHGLAGDGDRIPSQSILKYDVKVLRIEKLK
nr:FKBP-type peptidyl-prolyl cis-trans isomerase [uncultured Carboxylicivirga sp.]